MKKDNTVIVTGGAGFIGSRFVEDLHEDNEYNIIIIDNKSAFDRKSNEVKLLKDHTSFDYNDQKSIEDGLKGMNINTVFHIGACADVLSNNTKKMLDLNFNSSLFWYYFTSAKNIPFIWASSSAVYGNELNNVVSYKFEKVLNEYGLSKLLFDKFMKYDLKVNNANNKRIGLRFFNIFGRGESHKGKNASIPRRFYDLINDGGKIPLFNEEISRDYVHIDDLLKILKYCWKNTVDNGIYNLGSGESIQHSEIAVIIAKQYCAKKNKIFIEDDIIENIPLPNNLKEKFQYFTNAKELPDWVSRYTKNQKEKIKSYVNELFDM